MELNKELKAIHSSETCPLSMVRKTALHMRTNIRDQDVIEEWPPQPSQLTAESESLPAAAKQILQMIIPAHEEVSNQNIRVERQITLIGQYII